MKNIIVAMFMAITVTDLYWLDGDGDRTKSVLVIEYSDGTVDKLIVDKKELNSRHITKIVESADKIIQGREHNENRD